MTRIMRALAAGCLALTLAGAALAHDHEGHRQHGAHVHGLADMNIAVDGEVLEIELVAPAANIVGFEHAPRTDEQHAALDAAKQRLREADTIFGIDPAAECRASHVEVHSTLEDADDHDHHHHDDHAHDHDHAHSDIVAQYRFECARPERLAGLDVRLFEPFPGNEAIQVQVLTATSQDGLRLTPERTRVRW